MHAELTPENLRELVGRFYAAVREDDMIGPVFNAAIDDWDHHLDHIAQFWASGLLGVGRFTGRPMAAHMRHPIEPEMFDRWLAHWARTTDELYAPALARGLQARASRIADSFKLGLFYRPSQREDRDQA
ncbi:MULTISPECIES: group III truncated hemoglobin [Phenylobacterium]|uniref:Hemoglobin n=1 Tax=Phenylobacterium koreense TaxID=266125 RepID=A0ABV2EGV5_9CAUL